MSDPLGGPIICRRIAGSWKTVDYPLGERSVAAATFTRCTGQAVVKGIRVTCPVVTLTGTTRAYLVIENGGPEPVTFGRAFLRYFPHPPIMGYAASANIAIAPGESMPTSAAWLEALPLCISVLRFKLLAQISSQSLPLLAFRLKVRLGRENEA
jgi:hypothetical protein